jgi:hypothetical protein
MAVGTKDTFFPYIEKCQLVLIEEPATKSSGANLIDHKLL